MVRDDGTIVRQGGPPARKKMQAGQSNSGAKGFSKIRKDGRRYNDGGMYY